jgi:hypothetical protein
MASHYDAAQICLNGHVINDRARDYPRHNANFCQKCGAATTIQCPNCKTEIRGDYEAEGIAFIGASHYHAPAFCHDCGKAYPWTDSKIRAAEELIELAERLEKAEKDALAADLPDLIRDTPRTQVAAMRFKKLAAKIGGGVSSALRDIVVDVASDAAKKVILGS